MFDKLLIANRGEIACRIVRTCRAMGIATVAVYSDADADAPHVRAADEAVPLGPPPARESYLRIDAIIDAALRTGARAIHPGYGFLSENAQFAETVEAAGLVFVGPRPETIRQMALKDAGKALARAAGVPVLLGEEGDGSDAALLQAAERIGMPVLIKAIAGGGGRGMRRVDSRTAFQSALDGARREAESAFGDGRVLVEKYLATSRHIEVQVFGDGEGDVVHMFERDCSIQRRHQKVVEESPAPGLSRDMRRALTDAALSLARNIRYRGAGTVEFIAEVSEGLRPDRFWFMEMNTRLQVEHPVTETVTGLDLVEWQLRVAAGEGLPLGQDDITLSGHALEARVCAENPRKNYFPSPGTLKHIVLDDTVARVDTGVAAGSQITPYYDSLIAKIITSAPTRAEAIERMRSTLANSAIDGVKTNLELLLAICEDATFAYGGVATSYLQDHESRLLPPLVTAPNAS